MGEVYRAKDTRLNRLVAVKVLSSYIADSAARHRFQREAQMASSLNHPHILTVHDASEFEGQQYLVTEFVDGGTLKDWMRAESRTWAQIVELLVGVADGLAAAHSAGITHRDIKPANILVSKNGYAKLADFGLAKLTERAEPEEETLTEPSRPGVILGTIAYMSPEQALGRTVDARSDIFSFGVVLYELLTGRRPFGGSSEFEMLQNCIHAAPKPLPEDVPVALQAVVEKALEKDPADRYQTMSELVVDLRRLTRQTHERSVPSTLHPVGHARSFWIRRRSVRVASSLGLLALVLTGYLFWSQRMFRPTSEALDWYQRGVAAMHSMTYEAARRALEEAVAADPKFALAQATLARSYDELDYSDLAKDAMLRALTLAGETRLSGVNARKLRASLFMVSHDYERAAPLFAELEKEATKTEKPAAALESGWVAQQRGDTDGAATAYERALKMAPRYAAAKLRLGFIAGRRGQLDAALRAYTEAEALYSATSDYEGITESLLQKATLLVRSSRAAEAMPLLENALAVSNTVSSPSQQIRLELAKGVATRYLGDAGRASDLAQHAVDQAVSQKMENVATGGLIDLGNAFLVRGDLQAAEQYYRRALDFARRHKGRRNEARALFSLGSLFEQKNQPDDAQPFIEAALPFYRQAGYRRELVQASALLGGVHEQRSEFDEGIRILRETLPSALQLQDKQIEVQVRERLGDCFRDQGAWPDALVEYERAVDILGSGIQGVNARVTRAQLYWWLGRTPEAKQSLSEVEHLLSRGSGNEFATAGLRLVRAEVAYAEGSLAAAAALAEQVSSRADNGGSPARTQAAMLHALVLIRTGYAKEGRDSARVVIQQFERGKLNQNAASARLAAAEALLAAGDRGSAQQLAGEALGFFESRRIWEAAWRGHAVLARASEEPVEAKAHRASARSALDQLRSAWPPGTVDRYLGRPDIAPLYNSLQF